MNLNDERINQTLEALHSRARKQELRLVWENLSQWPNVLMGRGVRWNDRSGEKLQNKFICVDPQQGQLLYMLARCAGAQTILEFGTSFGVSTIYLAAAVRDNGGGKVYGTEFEPTKAKEAKKHLEQAGLSDRQWASLGYVAIAEQMDESTRARGDQSLANAIQKLQGLGTDDAKFYASQLQSVSRFFFFF